MFGLFGKKKQNPTPEESIKELNEVEDRLNKKIEHLESQIDTELANVKKNAKNKNTALRHLKKKKRLEQQLNQTSNTLTNIEFQKENLMNAKATAQTVKVMKNATDAQKRIHKENDIENIEDVMDDIQDQADLMKDLNDAMSRPIGYADMEDDDDLLAELEDIQQEEIDAQLLNVDDSIPVQLPTIPTSIPSQPTAVKKDEVDDLDELAAWAN